MSDSGGCDGYQGAKGGHCKGCELRWRAELAESVRALAVSQGERDEAERLRVKAMGFLDAANKLSVRRASERDALRGDLERARGLLAEFNSKGCRFGMPCSVAAKLPPNDTTPYRPCHLCATRTFLAIPGTAPGGAGLGGRCSGIWEGRDRVQCTGPVGHEGPHRYQWAAPPHPQGEPPTASPEPDRDSPEVTAKEPRDAMKTHDIKSHPEAFEAVWKGDKCHEIRVNDRDYVKGDRVLMREWRPSDASYTGRWVRAVVKHVTPGGSWGLPPELCVFSFHEVERALAAPPAGVGAEPVACACRKPGPGNGDSKCMAPFRAVCPCACHGAPAGTGGRR